MSSVDKPTGKAPDCPVVEEKAGYLVLRLKPGEGVMVDDSVEMRVASVSNRKGEVHIAIRAPRSMQIRRLR